MGDKLTDCRVMCELDVSICWTCESVFLIVIAKCTSLLLVMESNTAVVSCHKQNYAEPP